jgi:dihydrofolate reductase
MGRKTFESFPKPLPNRTHIIITREKNTKGRMYNSGCIDQALAVCPKDQDTYIIGGGEIYTLGLPYADKLDITRVHHSFEADTYFQISI